MASYLQHFTRCLCLHAGTLHTKLVKCSDDELMGVAQPITSMTRQGVTWCALLRLMPPNSPQECLYHSSDDVDKGLSTDQYTAMGIRSLLLLLLLLLPPPSPPPWLHSSLFIPWRLALHFIYSSAPSPFRPSSSASTRLNQLIKLHTPERTHARTLTPQPRGSRETLVLEAGNYLFHPLNPLPLPPSGTFQSKRGQRFSFFSPFSFFLSSILSLPI